MADKLIIPMLVLARHQKRTLNVPAIAPDYKTALRSYLGKYSSPEAFNKNKVLKKGVHLHFILPSALKKGVEEENKNSGQSISYPHVPERFIVTRMYVDNGKIETDCNIVESNFYSLDSSYKDSITIPKFDDTRARHRFRYMGRTYSASKAAPQPTGEYGYFDSITALGAGDPMFSAYYPSCSSVFGFYDDLDGVPDDAVLTYFVLGYYSNEKNDIFAGVKNADDMKKALQHYNFSDDDENRVCSRCILFGEVGGIDLSKDFPVPLGEINIGLGKSSAEALSAIIKGRYYDKDGIERFLTYLQYDTADTINEQDGNFRQEDDAHYRGFTCTDALEESCYIKLPEGSDIVTSEGFSSKYSDLIYLEREIGKLRRSLEYEKDSLYYLWELYEDADDNGRKDLMEIMNPIVNKIESLRGDITKKLTERNEKKQELRQLLGEKKAELLDSTCGPFYAPDDPALMMFGEGIKRTYAFGEDGRFENDNTLFCLTAPLTSNIPKESLLACFKDISSYIGVCDDYKDLAVTALLLDSVNLLPSLGLSPVINEKYSPIMFNDNPMENVTLLMNWESSFYPDYDNASPVNSRFVHGHTDYIYEGEMPERQVNCSGVTVLTPHGVYNLQDKLKKYLEYHSDSPDAAQIAEKIKDIAAVSQNLGGLNIGLTALKYVFQFPIDIDPSDEYSRKIAGCITPDKTEFYEPPAERPAVYNNTHVFPLREGYFRLSKLAVTTTFGEQQKIIDDELAFKGTQYISEAIQSNEKGYCFFPLNLTSKARLTADFVTARDRHMLTSPFLEATPIIAIFLPDMLNRNLNIFSNTGENIGTLKTAYRIINEKKTAVGRFVKSPNAPSQIDNRITCFIDALTNNNTAFYEVMEVIDAKLNSSLSMSESSFIFGRALVLAEMSLELEFFGGTEWSKEDEDIGKFNDMGLSAQKFPVYFGDIDRAADGLCCGFYDGFTKGFAAFGAEKPDNKYLNNETFSLSASEGTRNVSLLFDPELKVTINTGFLPSKQLEMYGEHIDFSDFQLLSSELNHIISESTAAQLPDFIKDSTFYRYYPSIEGYDVTYKKIDITKPNRSAAETESTMITDGIIVKVHNKEN